MSEINNLVYFLDLIKETLPFKDEMDFAEKIRTSKEFRIRVQKLVYLSKFFGWNNSYIFTLNEKGPYSINLANTYRNINLFNENSIKIQNFNIAEFKEFTKEKSNDFLEASTTILYLFKNNPKLFNKSNCINNLNKLKPELSPKTKINAFNYINRFRLIDKHDELSPSEIEIRKLKNNTRIEQLQKEVDSFDICRNQTLILGSLEYMRVVMKIETSTPNYEEDVLDFISVYIDNIESILKEHTNPDDEFETFDFTLVEKLFNQFQDYVSQELEIIPRLDDEDFDFENYC